MNPLSPDNPQQDRDEQVVLLLRHLFHEHFVPEENVPSEKVGFITPAYFFGWLDKNLNLMNGEEICVILNLPVDVWSFVREIVDSGIGPEQLFQMWYSIVLSNRPVPVNDLLRLNLVMLLTWADGTIFPVQVVITKEMMTDSLKFSDGLIASILAKNSQNMVNAVIEDGLDGLHDKGKDYRGATPEDPFEVCMGLIISPIKYKTLRQDLHTGVENYARLFQQICRPVIPPEILAAITAKKREIQTPDKPQGGWDV